MLIYNASKEKWVNADPNVTIVGDEVLRGADNRTLTDLYNHIQYIGTYRLQHKSYDSGLITVAAASETEYLSVSGCGVFISPRKHRVVNYGTLGKIIHNVKLDTHDLFRGRLDAFPASVRLMDAWGYNSVGNYTLGRIGFRVDEWDTTNNNYAVETVDFPERPFRSSLTAKLINNDSANDVDQQGVVIYTIFTASKQAFMTIPEYISATLLRKLVDKRVSAIEVMTMGYFEKEEEIPYYDLVNKEYPLTSLSSRKPLSYIAITYPDNVRIEQVLGRFKPKKILHDNIL